MLQQYNYSFSCQAYNYTLRVKIDFGNPTSVNIIHNFKLRKAELTRLHETVAKIYRQCIYRFIAVN